MSKPSCDSCNNLMELSPQFIQNGVTDNICASLKNNAGFSNSTTRTNCDDLHDANDCLIGKHRQKLKMFDSCEWPGFMEQFIPNLYELEKAIICSDCGQWEKLQVLEDRLEDLCAAVNQSIVGNLILYGILVGNKIKDVPSRIGGEIVVKDSIPAASARPEAEIGDYDALGILYRKLTTFDCDGTKKRTYEWIAPRFYFFRMGGNVEYNDVIWRVDKAKAKEWGLTDSILTWLEEYPQWWEGWASTRGVMDAYSLQLDVADEYLNLRLRGSLGDLKGKLFTGQELIPKVHVS